MQATGVCCTINFIKAGVYLANYKIPAAQAEIELVEKKSRFIAVCAPVATEPAALQLLEAVRKQHRTARHHVYAYSLQENSRQRYSDDGEPAKTAGLPVLEAVQHAGLCNCIVVVTRYFGGTLLGTGGLVRAYGGAARLAIEKAGISEIKACVTLQLSIPYTYYEQVRRLLLAYNAQIENEVFSANVAITAVMLESQPSLLLLALQELCHGLPQHTISQPFYRPF